MSKRAGLRRRARKLSAIRAERLSRDGEPRPTREAVTRDLVASLGLSGVTADDLARSLSRRHGVLVVKDFTEGLTVEERTEYAAIRARLDELDAVLRPNGIALRPRGKP
jgi:hypothetical protein